MSQVEARLLNLRPTQKYTSVWFMAHSIKITSEAFASEFLGKLEEIVLYT